MRALRRMIVAAAAVAAVAGCSDSATNPIRSDAPIQRAADRPSLDYAGPYRYSGFRSSYLVLTANGGTYNIGDGIYTLSVPANGVCVLGSTYGPTEWEAPCDTLGDRESIVVRATIGFANGGPVIDFAPSLRFNPKAQVTLSTTIYAQQLVPYQDYYTNNPWALRSFGMYYTSDFGVSGSNDAAFDTTVVTHVNLRTGVVWRRVKHFSGYNIAVGVACDPSPEDPNCVESAPQVDR